MERKYRWLSGLAWLCIVAVIGWQGMYIHHLVNNAEEKACVHYEQELWDALGKLAVDARDPEKRVGYDKARNMLEYREGNTKRYHPVADGKTFLWLNIMPLYDVRDTSRWTLERLNAYLQEKEKKANRGTLPVKMMVVDSTGRTADTYQYGKAEGVEMFHAECPLGATSGDTLHVYYALPREYAWEPIREMVIIVVNFSVVLVACLVWLLFRFKRERRNAYLRVACTRMFRHDLRLPITMILNTVYLLKEKAGEAWPEKAQQYLQDIETETRKTRDGIEKLIALQACESDLHPRRETVDLHAMVRRVVGETPWEAAAAYPCQVETDLRANRTTVRGDEDLLEAVLQNLIANGVKHASREVRIRVSTRDEGKRNVALTVEDDGPGIAPDTLRKLFDYRFRGEETRGRVDGSGLGLYLARRIVRMHRGRIYAESTEGKGSRFCIVLPYRKSKR